MNKNGDCLANEKTTLRDRVHTRSSLKKYQLSNSRSSSSIEKENPKSLTSVSPIFKKNPDLKSSNCDIKIHCAESEIITRNKELILAKGVWGLFNKTNDIFIENPSFRLDKKTETTNSLNVLSERKVSDDNENKRPLKDITKQVLPSIPQLKTPVQEISESLCISPNMNVSQRENKSYLEPGSNIPEIFSREKLDDVQIAKHIVKESDEESEDKENENAGSLMLSELNFNVDSFNMKYNEIIYPPRYYVELLDDEETGVTLRDFHLLLNNYTNLWNHRTDH